MFYILHARSEVYCGTDQHISELAGGSSIKISADPNAGRAPVMCNLHEVQPPLQEHVFHAVVTDRFFTSVHLALQLLIRNMCAVATVQPNK